MAFEHGTPGNVNHEVLKVFTKSEDALLCRVVRDHHKALGLRLLGRSWQASACFGAMVLLFISAQAGERIQIIETTNTATLPKISKEFVPPGSGILPGRVTGGESSQGPVLPHPGQPPALMRNPVLEDILDRKKNWAFESPNSVDLDRQLEETFGIRRFEMNGLERKSKTQVERYFDSKESATSKNQRKDSSSRESLGSDSDLDPRTQMSGDEESNDETSGGFIPALNPAALFNWNMPTDPFAQPGSILRGSSLLPPGLHDPMNGVSDSGQSGRDGTQSQRPVERSWEIRQSPLERFVDPINSQVDATRVIMNPIGAQKASVPPPESSRTRFGESYTFGGAGSLGSLPGAARAGDSFSFGAPKTVGPSSFNPPAAAPAASPIMQAKPVVLEIPRPRF